MLIKIPLEIVELDDNSYHLFVEGFVNGQKCNFIIDTGASKTVFALNHIGSLLSESPVSQPDIQSAGISATSLESHTGTVSQFKLGQFVIYDMEVVLIDLSSIDELYLKFADKSIWGLIGSDFLLAYKARLDYGRRTLTLNAPKTNFSEE